MTKPTRGSQPCTPVGGDPVRRTAFWAGLCLLVAYAAPLYLPPRVPWPLVPTAEDGLLQRMFPGLPPWWIVGRLACLVAGTALVGVGAPLALPVRLWAQERTRSARDGPLARAQRWPLGAALLLSVGLLVAGFYAHRLGRAGETAYLLLLAAPAVLIGLAERERLCAALRALRGRLPTLLATPALWLAWTVPVAWRSPRAATIVDGWMAIERLERVARGSQGLIDSAIPGFPNAHMLLEGAALYGPADAERLFGPVQVAHLFWSVVCAVLVGLLLWQLVGRSAAVVAQAIFLFSPFMMSCPYSPQPIYLMPLCSVALLLLLWAVHSRRSLAAIVAFGAVAGFSGQIAQHALPTALACLLVVLALSRWTYRPWTVIAVAAFVCAAAVLPSLPTLEALRTMSDSYTGGRGQYSGMEQVLFGQVTPLHAREALQAGTPGWLDVPLGALWAPFAIVRTPLRLWGDALFEPIGEVLIAVGLACCLGGLRRDPTARLAIGLVLAGIALAVSSAGDRVSHTRLIAAIVPLVCLAGVGFEAIRRAGGARTTSGWFTMTVVGGITIGGITLFDYVNPRILPSSALEITLEALDEESARGATILITPVEFLHERRIATQLPSTPVRVVDFQRFELGGASASPIYFWSPALESYMGYGAKFCDHWPTAVLHTLADTAGMVRTFAATPMGATWTPRLPVERWTASPCDRPASPANAAGN